MRLTKFGMGLRVTLDHLRMLRQIGISVKQVAKHVECEYALLVENAAMRCAVVCIDIRRLQV